MHSRPTLNLTGSDILSRLLAGQRPADWIGYWIGRSEQTGGVCVRVHRDLPDYGLVWKSDFPDGLPVGCWVIVKVGNFEDAMRASRSPLRILTRIWPSNRADSQALEFQYSSTQGTARRAA